MLRRMIMFGLTLAWWLVFSGCSSTTISGSWKDPQYQGGALDKVLVIGIAKQELMKHMYEDGFVAALQQRGISASPGYKVLPQNENNDKDVIVKRVKELGFKYVLMTRVAEKRTVEYLYPATTTIEGDGFDRDRYYRHYPYYNHYYDYFDRSYMTIIQSPAYTTTSELVILETNLYETVNGEIIYSVQTRSLLDYGAEATIKEVIQRIMENLQANQLI